MFLSPGTPLLLAQAPRGKLRQSSDLGSREERALEALPSAGKLRHPLGSQVGREAVPGLPKLKHLR